MHRKFAWMLAACGVLLIAWRLFLVGIADASMWFDDDYSWRIVREGAVSAVRSTAGDVHPPLYYLLLWGWMQLTSSEHLLVMRLLSSYAAVLTVAVTYRLAWMWTRNGWIALGAALFLSTSGMMIFYARILRMYALITLLTALSWWALVRLIRRARGGVIAYGVALAAMAWTFYFAAFVVIAQVVYVLVYGRARLRAVLGAFGVALVVFAPWLPVLLNQVNVARAQAGGENGIAIGKFLGTVPTSFDTLVNTMTYYTGGQPAFVLLLLVMGLAFGRHHQRRGLLAAVGWFFGTVGVLLLLNLFTPVYSYRYTVLAVPGLALCVGLALGWLRGLRVAALGVFMLVGVLTYPAAFPEKNVPHREMFSVIQARFRAGDLVWYNMDAGALGSSIYGAPAEYHLLVDAPLLNPDGRDFVWAAPADFDGVEQAARVWDVRPLWIEPAGISGDVLEAGRDVTELYDFGDYRVRLYEAPTTETVIFGDLLSFQTAPAPKRSYQPGETVMLKQWWNAVTTIDVPYSYSYQLRDPQTGAIITAQDTEIVRYPERENPVATLFWREPFAEPHYVARPFELPDDLPPGEYEVWMLVYFWQQPSEQLAVMPTGDNPPPIDGNAVQVASLRVTASE